MFLLMKHMMILIQVREGLSDEALAARRAQDRDHHAEVGDESNVNDDDDDDDVADDQRVIVPFAGEGK